MNNGFLNYYIVVKNGDDAYITYPSGNEGRPFDWDFFERETFNVAVVPQTNPINLFNAVNDTEVLVRPWRNSFKLIPTEGQGEAEYQMNIEKLYVPDDENLDAKPIFDYSFKHFIIDKIKGRKAGLSSKKQLIFKGRALNNKPCKLQIAFVLDDGLSYGAELEIGTAIKEYTFLLKDLKPVKTVTLPRPYPGFLPYYLEHDIQTAFDINNIESIQFSIGPGIPESELEEKHGVGIISVYLE